MHLAKVVLGLQEWLKRAKEQPTLQPVEYVVNIVVETGGAPHLSPPT